MLVPVLFLLVFFFYPLGAIFQISLFPDHLLDTRGFERLVDTAYYRETLWFTTWQAAVSTALTLALAIPGAHVFARYQFPGKSVLLALATLPFVLPTVVVAAAFTALVGNRGLLNETLMSVFNLSEAPIALERTLALIFIAHVFYNYAVAVRIISSFWATQNRRLQEAAMMLGASPVQVFLRVTLWLLMPSIAAAGALVFMFTFTSFGVVLLLGDLQKHATLEVEIYQQTTALFNLNTAAALSVVQLVATLLMMAVYTRLQATISRPVNLQAARSLVQTPKGVWQKLWVGLNLLVIVLLIFAPLAALVERSLSVGQAALDFRYYKALSQNERVSIIFVPPIDAIWNSLRFAVLAMGFALVLGTLAAYLLTQPAHLTRWLDPFFMLPLATSAVTLGFGFIIALDGDGWIDTQLKSLFGWEESPLNLRDSFWIVPIAHTLVAMPFVVRSVLPALRGIQPSVREAASVLGANPLWRWWWIDRPLIARGLLVGATFAFTVSMGEFGASYFVARLDQPTLPIVIFRFLGQPGIANYGQALAMSVILMAVCAVGFVVIERLNARVAGEF